MSNTRVDMAANLEAVAQTIGTQSIDGKMLIEAAQELRAVELSQSLKGAIVAVTPGGWRVRIDVTHLREWQRDVDVNHPLIVVLGRDGNAWCAHGTDFVNLAESPAGFGSTPDEAIKDFQWVSTRGVLVSKLRDLQSAVPNLYRSNWLDKIKEEISYYEREIAEHDAKKETGQ